jgi:hypothetical protein
MLDRHAKREQRWGGLQNPAIYAISCPRKLTALEVKKVTGAAIFSRCAEKTALEVKKVTGAWS